MGVSVDIAGGLLKDVGQPGATRGATRGTVCRVQKHKQRKGYRGTRCVRGVMLSSKGFFTVLVLVTASAHTDTLNCAVSGRVNRIYIV